MTARITGLRIESFRGATNRTERQFDPAKPLVVIFGENGTGKSTLVDALDLIANERIGSLKDRSSANEKKHAPAIGKKCKDIKVTVCRGKDKWDGTYTPPSFAEQANNYIRELSFVDWAREPLCRGEDVADLSTAYQRLDQVILGLRGELSFTFAKSLADWSAVGSKEAGVLGVEDVLSRVVRKVVEANNRVLFVVLDGMSWAVCHELLEDIRQDHWFEATLDEAYTPLVPIIATIPSITTYSRTSLLSGTLARGDQNLEKRNFEASRALVEVCDKRYPPVLFHKKDITEGNRGAISDALSKSMLSSNQRVVGVVINAIDDRLANAQQVIDNWSIGRISPLRALLRLARDSGRVVILASDHGHVWHRPDGEYRPHEEGSRWRTNDGTGADDEIVLRGSRVIGTDNGDYLETLARAMTGKLGGKVGIAPRLFLKKLVSDVLDRIDQFDDFDPRKHYQLTVDASEMSPVEREAQAHSVNDIELDL